MSGCNSARLSGSCLSWNKRQHAKKDPVSLSHSMLVTFIILIVIGIIRMLRRIVAVPAPTSDPGQVLPR
jgi:hypothetical protein